MNHSILARLRRKIRLGLDIRRQFGWRKFFFVVLPWLFNRRYFFYSQPIHPVRPMSSPCSSSIAMTRAEEDDLAYVTALNPAAPPLPVLKKRLKDGHLCFIGWFEGRPVQSRWVFTRPVYLRYLHQTLFTSAGEAFVDEAYTRPEMRGRGIATYTGYLLRLALLELGFKTYSCAVASWNEAQHRVAAKFGLEKVGEGGYIDLLFFKKFIWKGKIIDHGGLGIEIGRRIPEEDSGVKK